MDNRKLVRCNDTLEYTYATCCGKFGVFTTEMIDAATVPADFHTYYLTANHNGVVILVAPAARTKKEHKITGTFVSRDAVKPHSPGLGSLFGLSKEADLNLHPEKEFVFKEFFGFPPSIDCQISSACKRRDLEIAAKSKGKGKGKRKSASR